MMKEKFIIPEKNTLKLLKKTYYLYDLILRIGCNQVLQPKSFKIINGKPFDIRHLGFFVPIDIFSSKFKGNYN